jgi:hypothetical protein
MKKRWMRTLSGSKGINYVRLKTSSADSVKTTDGIMIVSAIVINYLYLTEGMAMNRHKKLTSSFIFYCIFLCLCLGLILVSACDGSEDEGSQVLGICLDSENSGQVDSDGDGVIDPCDPCPCFKDENQIANDILNLGTPIFLQQCIVDNTSTTLTVEERNGAVVAYRDYDVCRYRVLTDSKKVDIVVPSLTLRQIAACNTIICGVCFDIGMACPMDIRD